MRCRRRWRRWPALAERRPHRWADAALAVEIWLTFAAVRAQVFRRPLRDTAAAPRRAPRGHVDAARLGRAVDRLLRLGARRPRCLIGALVLQRLVRRRGGDATLVIGVRPSGTSAAAHAWVELAGRDVGPPPGRGDHETLARFG
jgi:hypothetical protein